MAKNSTVENPPATHIYRPNRWQILGSTYYVPRPKRRISRHRIYPARLILAAILLLCLVYVGTYFVLSLVLK